MAPCDIPSIHGHAPHRHPWLLVAYSPSMDIKNHRQWTMVLLYLENLKIVTCYLRRFDAANRPAKPVANNQNAAGTGTVDTPDTRTTMSL